MILVTVGTHPQGFDRLVQPMDEFSRQLDERVVIQYGSSTYTPHYAEAFRFTTGEEMAALTRQAQVVVTHAAAGTIILGLQNEKPMVLVPRLKRFGEVIDDHQKQLAQALHVQKRAVAVLDPTPAALQDAFQQIDEVIFSESNADQLIKALQALLHAWEAK